MSTRAIQGKNVTIDLKRNGVWIPYACATTVDVTMTTTLIKRTSPAAGNSAKYKPREIDWSGEFGGVTHALPLTDMWTVFQIAEETIRMQGLDLRITYADTDGNFKTISGHVLFPEINISAGADGFSEDSISFQGSGDLGLFNEPPPSNENTNNVDWRTYRGIGGEFGFTEPLAIGRPKYYVERAGQLVDPIFSGTPTVQQVRINTATGQVVFNTSLDPGEPVYLQWRIS